MYSALLVTLLCTVQWTCAVPLRKETIYPRYCDGTNASDSTVPSQFTCADPRLGPVILPTTGILASMLVGYDPFGGQSPGDFLANWTSKTDNSYIYPSQDGFQIQTNQAPVEGTVTLPLNTLVDRFGRETGRYLAPYGTPYMQRALPPNSLTTYDPATPGNYYVYEVTKPFDVQSGPIYAWFSQPGGGTQYETSMGVNILLAQGFLRRVNMTELA